MKIKLVCIVFSLFAIVSGNSLKSQDLSALLKLAQPYTTGNDTSQVDWTTQFIRSKGWCVLDTIKWRNKSQAKLMAIRCATVIAQRNLLETIKGVNIDSKSTVANMMAQSDTVRSNISGLLERSEQFGDPIISGDIVEVTMQVPIYKKNGLADVVTPDNISPEPTPAPNPKIDPNDTLPNIQHLKDIEILTFVQFSHDLF
jgi:hypothetical protein